MKESCENCRCWEADPSRSTHDPPRGCCRNNSPVLLPTALGPGYYGKHPSVDADQWCGEWKEIKPDIITKEANNDNERPEVSNKPTINENNPTVAQKNSGDGGCECGDCPECVYREKEKLWEAVIKVGHANSGECDCSICVKHSTIRDKFLCLIGVRTPEREGGG